MKLLRSFGLLALLALTLLPAATRGAEKANPGWERMKSLVGEWDGLQTLNGVRPEILISRTGVCWTMASSWAEY